MGFRDVFETQLIAMVEMGWPRTVVIPLARRLPVTERVRNRKSRDGPTTQCIAYEKSIYDYVPAASGSAKFRPVIGALLSRTRRERGAFRGFNE